MLVFWYRFSLHIHTRIVSAKAHFTLVKCKWWMNPLTRLLMHVSITQILYLSKGNFDNLRGHLGVGNALFGFVGSLIITQCPNQDAHPNVLNNRAHNCFTCFRSVQCWWWSLRSHLPKSRDQWHRARLASRHWRGPRTSVFWGRGVLHSVICRGSRQSHTKSW